MNHPAADMTDTRPLADLSAAVHTAYRPDIDGLRAVAVLAVVLFHAFPDLLPGGFIGVDVFFVISGFLISTIIYSRLEFGAFSLADFYARRIRRIFPALTVVLAATYALGWNVLFADEFRQLGKHMAGGVGFLSNFVLLRESGYFDNAAETKPLLHLWSLAIEEQFYVFWPLVLMAAWKRKSRVLAVLLAVAALSFVLNLLAAARNPVLDFYLPLCRFWELAAGAVLGWLVLYRPSLLDRMRGAQALAGLALFGIGLLLIDRTSAFPGWWALLPTAAAFLLIAAGPAAPVNRMLLSNRVLVWVGLISFPLYLWHWPLLAYARILAGGVPPVEVRAAIVLLSVLVSWLTYRLVEQPLRHAPRAAAALAVTLACVGAAGVLTYRQDGLPSRAFEQDNMGPASGKDGGDLGMLAAGCGVPDGRADLYAQCVHDRRGPARFALLGDSKAAALIGGLARTSHADGRWLFIGGTNAHGAPVPVLSQAPFFRPNQALLGVALDALARNGRIETVALAAATRHLFPLRDETNLDELPAASAADYALARDGLDRAVAVLTRAGKKVVLIVDNPTLPDPRECLQRSSSLDALNRIGSARRPNPRCTLSLERHRHLTAIYMRLLADVQARHPDRVAIFDPTALLCDTALQVCLPHAGGRLLYSYSDHISDYAAGRIGRALDAQLAR